MPRIWIIKPNLPELWSFNGVCLENGKRTMGDWISELECCNFIKCINISETDDGCEFLNILSTELECSTESYANTIQIYNHPKYKIECSYRSDLNFQNSKDFNYFTTVVNIESVNVFGSSLYCKTSNKKLVDLSLEELISQLVNFYFLRTYKLSNGKFQEIAINNFEPDIENMLRGYKVKKFNNWLVFSDDNKSNLNSLKESNNNILEFNNLIWLKIKNHVGDIHRALENANIENNREGDLRGIYMDLDPEYIISVFF
jgi:hypothetical protein